jgi:hypothetical protein
MGEACAHTAAPILPRSRAARGEEVKKPLHPFHRDATLMPAVRQAADGSDDGRLRFRNWRQLVV